MEQLSYKIDVFEGPMDLLLHLISKHKFGLAFFPKMGIRGAALATALQDKP